MSVYKQLSALQASLNAPKGQFNKFGNYHYRSCEDILQAAKPLLGDAVILVTDEIKLIGDRYYVEATAKFILDGDVIENKAYAREPLSKKGMDESQITGSTSSYARKYALNGLLLIDDNKDADSMNNKEQGSCSATTAKTATKKPSYNSELLSLLSSGDEIGAVQFWRSISQEQQQYEWSQLDKTAQKSFKQTLIDHPAQIKGAA